MTKVLNLSIATAIFLALVSFAGKSSECHQLTALSSRVDSVTPPEIHFVGKGLIEMLQTVAPHYHVKIYNPSNLADTRSFCTTVHLNDPLQDFLNDLNRGAEGALFFKQVDNMVIVSKPSTRN